MAIQLTLSQAQATALYDALTAHERHLQDLFELKTHKLATESATEFDMGDAHFLHDLGHKETVTGSIKAALVDTGVDLTKSIAKEELRPISMKERMS